jgi:hypothetical protein
MIKGRVYFFPLLRVGSLESVVKRSVAPAVSELRESRNGAS